MRPRLQPHVWRLYPTHPGCNAMCLSCSPASLPLSYPFTLLVLKLYTLLDTLLLFFSYPTLHRRCAASPSRYAAAVRALRGRRGARTRLLTSCCVCHTGLEPQASRPRQAGQLHTHTFGPCLGQRTWVVGLPTLMLRASASCSTSTAP